MHVNTKGHAQCKVHMTWEHTATRRCHSPYNLSMPWWLHCITLLIDAAMALDNWWVQCLVHCLLRGSSHSLMSGTMPYYLCAPQWHLLGAMPINSTPHWLGAMPFELIVWLIIKRNNIPHWLGAMPCKLSTSRMYAAMVGPLVCAALAICRNGLAQCLF